MNNGVLISIRILMEPERQRRVSFGSEELGPAMRTLHIDLNQRPMKAILKSARKAGEQPMEVWHFLLNHTVCCSNFWLP